MPSPALPAGTVALIAAACAALVANLYYAQPLVGLIGPAIGLRPELHSLVVTLTQIGYTLGLLFVVPLGDRMESRHAIATLVFLAAGALVAAALAPNATVFLAASFLIGLFATGTQMLIPLAAHLAPDAIRGRVVGNVMAGLLLGILLARPVASLVAAVTGWRGLFGLAAAVACGLGLLLMRTLPSRLPDDPPRYRALIASLLEVFRANPVLRRRMAYQAPLFAGFSLFWTAVPLELAGPRFGLGQPGIAVFALAGAAGALSAPLAGRAADRGLTRRGTALAITTVVLGFVLCWLGGRGSIALLVLAALAIDAGVQGNQVLGQRAIYSLAPAIRSRLNGLLIAASFVGGASGSAVASAIYVHAGWDGVALTGALVASVPLLLWSCERRSG